MTAPAPRPVTTDELIDFREAAEGLRRRAKNSGQDDVAAMLSPVAGFVEMAAKGMALVDADERRRARRRVDQVHVADPGIAADRGRDLDATIEPLPEDER